MDMVWNKRPGITGRLSLGQEFSKTIQEILPILIASEYLSTLYPSDHDVMQHTRRLPAIARLRRGGRVSSRASLGIKCLLSFFSLTANLEF